MGVPKKVNVSQQDYDHPSTLYKERLFHFSFIHRQLKPLLAS